MDDPPTDNPPPAHTPGRIKVPDDVEGEPFAFLVKGADGKAIADPPYHYETDEDGTRYLVFDEQAPDADTQSE